MMNKMQLASEKISFLEGGTRGIWKIVRTSGKILAMPPYSVFRIPL